MSEDLRRYFAGLSAQFTPVLDAAWHGHVRFCTDTDEAKVLEALAVLVVQPPPDASLSESGLPGGAEQLLAAFSGRALVRVLEAVQPADPAEADRKFAALQVVRKATDR
ncbi:MAG: hypothetical protein ABIQ70_00465 [Dokdonella sp.]